MSESETPNDVRTENRSILLGVKYELRGVFKEPVEFAAFYGPPGFIAGIAAGLTTQSAVGAVLGAIAGVLAWFGGLALADPPYALSTEEYRRATDPDDEYRPALGRLK